MREASKTRLYRGQAFMDRYFSGKVLDIGCGPDLVVPHAQPFDVIHGDANHIADYLPAEAYDCVHSSHCLEHMRDVPHALRQWWSLVKPGGVMIIAVPEENLYEQGVWPSMFNWDHKATFRLDTKSSWSPVSYDLKELVQSLPEGELIEAEIQDSGYDYGWQRSGLGMFGGRPTTFFRRARRGVFRRLGIPPDLLGSFFVKVECCLGRPIDQTLGDALAQIQVVVRKREPLAGKGDVREHRSGGA